MNRFGSKQPSMPFPQIPEHLKTLKNIKETKNTTMCSEFLIFTAFKHTSFRIFGFIYLKTEGFLRIESTSEADTEHIGTQKLHAFNRGWLAVIVWNHSVPNLQIRPFFGLSYGKYTLKTHSTPCSTKPATIYRQKPSSPEDITFAYFKYQGKNTENLFGYTEHSLDRTHEAFFSTHYHTLQTEGGLKQYQVKLVHKIL